MIAKLVFYCFCAIIAFVAIIHGMIENLAVVLILISLAACIEVILIHNKIERDDLGIPTYAVNALYVLAVVLGAVDSNRDLSMYIYSVFGVWAIIVLVLLLFVKGYWGVLRFKKHLQ